MARRLKRTQTDPAFLSAVSDALVAYKVAEGATNASLAGSLGVDESTIAAYIRKEAPIMAQVLARACINLGIRVKYNDYVISAASFPGAEPATPRPVARQLKFLFDADYSDRKSTWKMDQRDAEPMEFTLRIKVAS